MSDTAKMEKLAYRNFATFEEFYPFYLGEHRNRMCKLLHFMGTVLVISAFLGIVVSGQWTKVWVLPLCGYSFAWIGHFFYEKNRPATFKMPLYSLRGDFVMFWHILTGRLPLETDAPLKASKPESKDSVDGV